MKDQEHILDVTRAFDMTSSWLVKVQFLKDPRNYQTFEAKLIADFGGNYSTKSFESEITQGHLSLFCVQV